MIAQMSDRPTVQCDTSIAQISRSCVIWTLATIHTTQGNRRQEYANNSFAIYIRNYTNEWTLVVEGQNDLHRTAVGRQRVESNDIREVDGRLIVTLRLYDFAGLQLLRHSPIRTTNTHRPRATLDSDKPRNALVLFSSAQVFAIFIVYCSCR